MNSPAQDSSVAVRTDLSEVALDGPLKNMAQAWAIAKVVAQSSMVPQALRGSPQNVLVTMMLGQELGLTWTQATRGIYVLPNGTPGLRGQLLLAMIRSAGHRYRFERDENSCRCVITRKDEDFKVEYDGEFNLDDAKAAGLVHEKDGKLTARSNSGQPLPWEQYRRDMLQWRAVARAAGIGAPEVIYGFDLAGIGDGADGTATTTAPSGPAPAPVYAAEVVQDAKQQLAQLDAQMKPGEPPAEPAAQDKRGPQADYEVTTPPDYADLETLLKRCGYHGDAQADVVSALIHRNVTGVGDLSKAEVFIAHDALVKATKDKGPVGARRAAIAELVSAEQDAWAQSEEEQ